MSGASFIGATFGGANAFSVSRTPAAGNDLILQVLAFASSGDTPTITDSTGATVIADFAFSGGIGVYRVHNATAVSHTLNVSWSTAPSNWYLTLNEAANIGAVDTAAGAVAIATGTSATPTTGSLDPPANGDLLFSAITINHFLSSLGSLTNGFTQTEVNIGGPSYIQAYLPQSTAASVNCGATANTSEPWAALLIAYTAAPTITIGPTTAPGGTVGTAYSQQFTAAGGTSPYTYTISAGTPPPGLSLSSSGLLSGTPTTAGSYSFTIKATDANSFTGTQPYSGVTISNPAVTISPSSLAGAPSNTVFNVTLSASGGFAPYTFAVTSGALPPGLTLWPNGMLAGPLACPPLGAFTFVVQVTDSRGYTGTQGYSFVVTQGPPFEPWLASGAVLQKQCG